MKCRIVELSTTYGILRQMKQCRCVPASLRAEIPNGTLARWHDSISKDLMADPF